MRYFLPPLLVLLLCTCGRAQNSTRWSINESGNGIVWDVASDTNLPHGDNIEMSGRGVSMVVDYQVDSNRMVKVQRRLIYPQFRSFIKDTDPAWWATYRNYLRRNYEDEEVLPHFYVEEREMTFGPVENIRLDGKLTITHATNHLGLQVIRTFYPGARSARAFEKITFVNRTESTITISAGSRSSVELHTGKESVIATRSDLPYSAKDRVVYPGKELSLTIMQSGTPVEGRIYNKAFELIEREAEELRDSLIEQLTSNLTLETPNPIYNTMFSLAKIRGAESIFDSKLGLVHSPGGERYYAGFWANDQAEYINPFFPYLGYDLGNEAALNMWRVYQKAIPTDGSNIRYSFEMHGDAPANPLDRGDAAMIAYGLSHYLLALGDRDIAKELWPLLEWCLAYNHKMLTRDGVVASESDEMEGRIETGDANLSTSSLYYGALETSISLASELGHDEQLLNVWAERRKALARSIENFFGRTVEGLDTYRYFDGHKALRHWIALPLVVGLHDRREGTLEGLFDRLWTDNGVAVEKNHPDPNISKVFWDRGTLYALRGAFISDGTERAHERLLQFSRERLLGERVPYVVEAYPEGGMAHLSAESGLYCRVFTEGVFGILPTGFRSFRLQPRMPEGWNEMALRNIHAFGQTEGFDLEVSRSDEEMTVRVLDGFHKEVSRVTFAEGEAVEIKL